MRTLKSEAKPYRAVFASRLATVRPPVREGVTFQQRGDRRDPAPARQMLRGSRMSRSLSAFWVLISTASLLSCATANGGAGTRPPGTGDLRLPEPDYLLPLARRVLNERMKRHGHDMPQLMLSVVLLQRDVAAEAAKRIANEPLVMRPPPGDDSLLNSALPPRFFVLQDELRQRAKALSDAADQKDDKALAVAFGQLTETCVACHSAYLNP